MFSAAKEIDHTEDFVATVHYRVEPQQTAVSTQETLNGISERLTLKAFHLQLWGEGGMLQTKSRIFR